MDMAGLQAQIAATFGARDRARGVDGTFRRLIEEVGELAKALRGRDRDEMALELSDVVAWTLSVAAAADIDLNEAMRRYEHGCPRCHASPCRCPMDGAR
jgi:NTP pyrophosphatase (non-canonical NTP hydrolase)